MFQKLNPAQGLKTMPRGLCELYRPENSALGPKQFGPVCVRYTSPEEKMPSQPCRLPLIKLHPVLSEKSAKKYSLKEKLKLTFQKKCIEMYCTELYSVLTGGTFFLQWAMGMEKF